jgi:hypothetical protein
MKTITLQFGPANQLTKQLADNTTLLAVLSDPSIKAAMGFGDNVQALDEDRRHLNAGGLIVDGANYIIETIANQKAALLPITISFGPANELTKQVHPGTTIGDLKRDPSIKAVLNFGDNVKALIDRVEAPDDYRLLADDHVELETIASQKTATVPITISYGPANELTKQVREGTTIGDLKRDRSIKAVLNVGNNVKALNVKALIDRVEAPDDYRLLADDHVELETIASQKTA